MDDEHGHDAEREVESERVEAPKGVKRPDDAVAVGVEEVAVLLEDGLVRVRVGPRWGALGRVRRCGLVDSRSTCIYAPDELAGRAYDHFKSSPALGRTLFWAGLGLYGGRSMVT